MTAIIDENDELITTCDFEGCNEKQKVFVPPCAKLGWSYRTNDDGHDSHYCPKHTMVIFFDQEQRKPIKSDHPIKNKHCPWWLYKDLKGDSNE